MEDSMIRFFDYTQESLSRRQLHEQEAKHKKQRIARYLCGSDLETMQIVAGAMTDPGHLIAAVATDENAWKVLCTLITIGFQGVVSEIQDRPDLYRDIQQETGDDASVCGGEAECAPSCEGQKGATESGDAAQPDRGSGASQLERILRASGYGR